MYTRKIHQDMNPENTIKCLLLFQSLPTLQLMKADNLLIRDKVNKHLLLLMLDTSTLLQFPSPRVFIPFFFLI